jgi:hypothetical protein
VTWTKKNCHQCRNTPVISIAWLSGMTDNTDAGISVALPFGVVCGKQTATHTETETNQTTQKFACHCR